MPLLTRLAAGAASAALLASGTVALATPAHAAGGVTIDRVAPNDEWGGLSPFLFSGCAILVEFTDTSPSKESAYTVTVPGVGSAGAWQSGGRNKFASIVECDTSDLVDGVPVDVTVTENKTSTTTYAWTPDVLQGPVAEKSMLKVERSAKGFTATIAHDGEYEDGLRYEHQAWTSPTRTFTGADWDANTRGNAAVKLPASPDRALTSFTVPAGKEGRWLWFSVVANGTPEQFSHPIFWGPVFIGDEATPKAMPKKWITSYGTESGQPKVGRTVKVSAPTFSAAGKKQKLKVTRQWFVGGKKIAGATKASLEVTKKFRGKKLTVRVTVAKAGYVSRTSTISFGTVR